MVTRYNLDTEEALRAPKMVVAAEDYDAAVEVNSALWRRYAELIELLYKLEV